MEGRGREIPVGWIAGSNWTVLDDDCGKAEAMRIWRRSARNLFTLLVGLQWETRSIDWLLDSWMAWATAAGIVRLPVSSWLSLALKWHRLKLIGFKTVIEVGMATAEVETRKEASLRHTLRWLPFFRLVFFGKSNIRHLPFSFIFFSLSLSLSLSLTPDKKRSIKRTSAASPPCNQSIGKYQQFFKNRL